VYEFLVGMVIAAFLWRLGTRGLSSAKPKGEIFCYFLILTGAARFLVEFIRINPRVLYGLTNAQVVSVVSIVVGAVLIVWLKFGAQKSSEAA
jgi:phosphatidylglycerol:prolipoprotein diacylglycerol transferase